ncbi:MAG TPA: hypothetical protein VIT20_11960 [Propionibacteriaceae bacterium]
MGDVGWDAVVALLTSVGFGILSAVFPVANAEAYVIVSQVSAVAGPVSVAIGIAIGQTIGKILLFLGVRRGKEFPFVRRHRAQVRAAPAGPARTRFRAALATLLSLVGQKRWGLPVVFVAALVGIPPLFAVALLAGATQMKVGWFALIVLAGRIGRFVLVALGVSQLHPWFV